mgnify:CR=1 FL=1
MKITIKEGFRLINTEETSFKLFYNNLIDNKITEPSTHLVIELSENLNTTIKDLSLFLDYANAYRSNGMSFVVICNGIDIDEVPDEINVVPTLTEAKDVLEMEAIERDLGF